MIMRNILTIAQLLVIFMLPIKANAQYPKLEIKLSVVEETSLHSADAEIQVIVEGERPPYVYQLFNKAPWEGGKELAASNKTEEYNYSFDHLTNGNYFICVTDSEGNSKCEYVTIKKE
jgi:hypothetical protein